MVVQIILLRLYMKDFLSCVCDENIGTSTTPLIFSRIQLETGRYVNKEHEYLICQSSQVV